MAKSRATRSKSGSGRTRSKAGAAEQSPGADAAVVIDPALGPVSAGEAVPRLPTEAGAPAAVRAGAARELAIDAARLLGDDKCEDVILLDVRGLSPMCDYIVIGTGTSNRQMRAVSDDVAALGKERGFGPARQNVDDRVTWCVTDMFDVVVHVFEPNTRAYYDLEMMWGDAPRLDWARPEGETPARARARDRSKRSQPDGQGEIEGESSGEAQSEA